MYNNFSQDEILRAALIQTFVKKECDLEAWQTRVAMVASAQGMAPAIGEGYSREIIEAACSDILNLNNEMRRAVQMMNSSFVRKAIGYSISFEDYSAARTEYECNRTAYDQLYQGLEMKKKKEEEQNHGMSL